MANASESSLMKRTKAELIQIILRKDQTEAEQSKQIKELNERKDALNVRIEGYEKDMNAMSSKCYDLEAEIDDLTVCIEEQTNDVSKWKFTAITAIGIAVIFGLVLLF